jgi:hypothetical protein
VLKVSKTNSAYRAALDLIELGQNDFPVTALAYKKGTVRLQLGTSDHYEGTVNPTGTEIHGFFISRSGGQAEVVWKRTTHPDVPPPPLVESDYAPAGNSSLEGFWEGYASIKGIPMRMNLKISQPSIGRFRAELDYLDFGIKHVPVTIAYDRPTVGLTCLGAELDGTMNRSDTEFQGVIPLGSPDIPWAFTRGHHKPTGDFFFTTKMDLQGDWRGMLNVEGIKLRLFLHIARLPDGKYSATVDSPDGGLDGVLATAVRFQPPKVRIEWVWMGWSFAGELERGELSGVWSSTDGTKTLVVFQRSDLK